MRIAYLTTDEVNQDLALRLAEDWGFALEVRWPREAPPDGRFDAVLYDWDALPREQQAGLRAELLAGPAGRPVALHGYGLGGREERALRRHGVAVFRRLESKTFLTLERARVAQLRQRPAVVQPQGCR